MTECLPHGGEPLLDVFVQRGEKLRKGPFRHLQTSYIQSWPDGSYDNGNFGPNSARQASERLAVAAAADMIDRERRLAARCAQQFACARLARRVHAVADRRAKAGRIRPFIENPVGERRERTLHLMIEAAAPAAVEALQAP